MKKRLVRMIPALTGLIAVVTVLVSVPSAFMTSVIDPQNSNRPVVRVVPVTPQQGNVNANINSNSNRAPARRIPPANTSTPTGNINRSSGTSPAPPTQTPPRTGTTTTTGVPPTRRVPSTETVPNPNTLPPSLKIQISQRVDIELAKLGRTKSVSRDSFVVPTRAQTFPAVALMNEKLPMGVFECIGPAKTADDLTVEETADRLIITFRCERSRNGLEFDAQPGNNKLSIAFQKGAMPQLFATPARRSGVAYGPLNSDANGRRAPAVGGRAPDGSSRDDYELSNCLSAFRRYKTDPRTNYFQVRFMTRVYRCDTSSSQRAHLLEQSAVFGDRLNIPKINPASLPTDLRVRVEKPAKLYDPDYKGVREKTVTYDKTFFLDQSQVTSSQTHDLVFAIATKQPTGKVAVQVASQPQPIVNGCINWDQTEGLLRQAILPAAFGPAPTEANLKGKSAGATQAGTVTVNDSFVVAGLPPTAKNTVYLRVVPISSGKVSRCVGGPSPWIMVDVGNVSYVIAHAQQYLLEEQQKKAEAFKKALGAAGIKNLKDSSPIKVTILSYVSPNIVDGLFTSHSNEELIYGTDNPAYTSHMNLNPSFGWPSEYRIWPNYPQCAFNAYELTIAATAYKELPDNAWEMLVYVVDYASFIYAKLQDVIVNGMSFAISGTKCDANDEHPTGACLYLRETLKTALRMFLAYLGIPPALPSMSELIGKANEYVATNIVDFAMGLIPAGEIPEAVLDLTREAMLQAARAAMEAATHSLRCGLPIPPGKTAKDMGYDEQNTNGCGKVGGDLNPYNWAMKNIAFYERPAVIYLKVERNTGPNVINLTTGQTITITDDSLAFEKKLIPITDVSRIPSNGWLIPVVLAPNLDKFVDQSRCNTPGALATCVDTAKEKDLWVNAMTNGAIANLKVTTQFKWTADPALSITNTGALDSNFLGVSWGGYKGRIDSDNGDFGVIASPPPCPGFKFKVCAGGKPCGTVNNWH